MSETRFAACASGKLPCRCSSSIASITASFTPAPQMNAVTYSYEHAFTGQLRQPSKIPSFELSSFVFWRYCITSARFSSDWTQWRLTLFTVEHEGQHAAHSSCRPLDLELDASDKQAD